jgi:DNA-binding MarR family transcriptional regulator
MLPKLFTKKNIEVLKFLVSNKLHIRDIADQLAISPAKVHHAIQLFKQYDLVKEEQVKNRRVIHLNAESELLKSILHIIDHEEKRAHTYSKGKYKDYVL